MTRRVCFRKTVLWFAVLLFTYFVAENVNYAMAEQPAFAAPGPYQITGIETSKADNGIVLRVTGSAPPTFTMYELFEPQRIILDIADGSFVNADGSVVETLELPMEAGTGPVTKIKGQILNDKKPLIARLEMFTSGDASYTVERAGNDILVNVKKKDAAASSVPPVKKPAESAPALVAETKKSPVMKETQAEPDAPMEQKAETAQPVEATVAETSAPPATETSGPVSMPSAGPVAPSPVADEFAYAGYEKQPITVDFYKIDLHNVFRLFGEISGMNIVIAQGVGGTLTLALDNVPWDFVLDVILNLQNLQAIERFNTIVIAPKGATFEWPEREEDKVAVKKDKAILMEGEKLQVVQKMEMSPEVLEAQKLIREARAQEKQEQFEEALMLYEKAFEMWPDNGKLAGRLASLYLVHMGMNAKAVYYGKEALKIDENDAVSALYTAIGLANMKRNSEAKEYFETAVSSKRPDSEALISYAMFSEENGSYLDALLLLARHEDLYGDSLDTMIARARILDKEGNSEKAAAEYRAILLSGYQLPADLTRYIKGRLALEGTQSKGQM
jgi:type IV pilus assembly protein PilQ